jgi:lactate dehydrogenase-like 2-hydroxyacid dehydrogenase
LAPVKRVGGPLAGLSGRVSAYHPDLQFIAVTAVGTDPVDLEACRRRGIRVSNCTAANVESVSNHALALYLAARRKIIQMNTTTASGDWANRVSPISSGMVDRDGNMPLTFEDEVVGILGYGAVGMLVFPISRFGQKTSNCHVGKKIAQLSEALGMKVLIATQKNSGEHKDNRKERVPFEEVLKKSTVIFVAVPRVPSTMNLISTAEFQFMSPKTVLVKIERGGIVDEAALLRALKDRSIYGAATDVFANGEPATPETSVLLSEEARDLNLTLSPHLAWFAERTMKNYLRMSPENVRNFILDQPTNLVV